MIKSHCCCSLSNSSLSYLLTCDRPRVSAYGAAQSRFNGPKTPLKSVICICTQIMTDGLNGFQCNKPYFAVYLAVIDTMSDGRRRSGKTSKSRFLRQFVSVCTHTQSPATLFTFFLKGAIAVVMLVFQGPSLLCHLSRPIQKNL